MHQTTVASKKVHQYTYIYEHIVWGHSFGYVLVANCLADIIVLAAVHLCIKFFHFILCCCCGAVRLILDHNVCRKICGQLTNVVCH